MFVSSQYITKLLEFFLEFNFEINQQMHLTFWTFLLIQTDALGRTANEENFSRRGTPSAHSFMQMQEY